MKEEEVNFSRHGGQMAQPNGQHMVQDIWRMREEREGEEFPPIFKPVSPTNLQCFYKRSAW